MQYGPKIVTDGLSLNVDFGDLYFNDASAANVIYNSDVLSGFINYQSGTISTVIENGPFGKSATMALINADNSGLSTYNPFHVYKQMTSTDLVSGQTYIADYFTKTTSNRQVKSQFTYDINSATYTEIGYGIHPSGEWKRVLHQYTYTTGTTNPRFFLVDEYSTPAGPIYNYRTNIYKFNPINKASDAQVYYKNSFLKAAVNTDGTIQFFNGSGSSSGAEYIIFNDNYSFANTSNFFTYEIMVQIKENTTGSNILMGRIGYNAGILQSINSIFFSYWDSVPAIKFTASYATFVNEWCHIVGVFDGSYIYLYVNGNLIGNPVAVTSFRAGYATGSNLLIGGYPNYSYTCGCKVSFFRMYKKALTNAQIKNNFNQVRKRFNI